MPGAGRPLPLGGASLVAATILALLAPTAGLGAQVASPDPSEILGTWAGRMDLPGGASLAFVFHFALDASGSLVGTAESPDQGAFGIPVSSVLLSGDSIVVLLPAVAGRYDGVRVGEDTIRGSWRQGGGSIPLDVSRGGEAATAPPRPQDPAPPFPYRVEEVVYANHEAGIELAGTLTLPEGAGPFPAVVLISGSGPQDRDSSLFGHRPFLVLADHLSRRGIAVLRSDDRGVAGSGGDFSSATSADFASDALAAATLLSQRPEVDPGRIGLIGHSEGGIIAPMSAARSPLPSYLVLLAGPALTGEEILYLQAEAINRAGGATEEAIQDNRQFQEILFTIVREERDPATRTLRMTGALEETLARLGPDERAELGISIDDEAAWVAAQLAALDTDWFRFFITHDPLSDLVRVNVPILALFGERDLQVPAAPNQAAMEAALGAAGHPDYTLMTLPSLNHLFQTAPAGLPGEYGVIEETFSPDALDQIVLWILERFGP